MEIQLSLKGLCKMIESLIIAGVSAVIMFILFFLVPTDRTGKRN